MRLASWLGLMGAAFALPVQACSGGYPLAPTPCDEWCDASKGGVCQDYYDPANCVAECERNDMDRDACRPAFDAMISCFRHSPRALEQRCAYDDLPDDCATESQWLGACLSAGIRLP